MATKSGPDRIWTEPKKFGPSSTLIRIIFMRILDQFLRIRIFLDLNSNSGEPVNSEPKFGYYLF